MLFRSLFPFFSITFVPCADNNSGFSREICLVSMSSSSNNFELFERKGSTVAHLFVPDVETANGVAGSMGSNDA